MEFTRRAEDLGHQDGLSSPNSNVEPLKWEDDLSCVEQREEGKFDVPRIIAYDTPSRPQGKDDLGSMPLFTLVRVWGQRSLCGTLRRVMNFW